MTAAKPVASPADRHVRRSNALDTAPSADQMASVRPISKTPPAGSPAPGMMAEQYRRSRLVADVGLIIPPAIDQGEPSRPGLAGLARSSGGALQLDPRGLARSLTGSRRQTG
jgi:hypothetical protein